MHHKKRKLLWAVLAIIVLLIAARVALPVALQRYVNQTLNSAEGYDGHVGDIDLAIWRGAYVIHDVEIKKAQGNVYAPFFTAEKIDLSILMAAVLRGNLVGELIFHKPTVNIVVTDEGTEDADAPEDIEQTGEQSDWQRVVTDLFPLRFDLVEVREGELHYRKPDSDPKVDVYLTNLNATLENFTNSRELSDSLVATLTADAAVMRNGSLDFTLEMDPYADQAQFDFKGKLLDLKLASIDDLIRAYTPIDVEAGTLDVVAELAAQGGRLTGYVKPLLHNVEVFKWREDVKEQDDNFLRIAWEGLVDGLSELFENQPRDLVATRIPIDGDISGPRPEIFTTVINILRNAFVSAFEAKLEGNVEPPGASSPPEPQVTPQSGDSKKQSQGQNQNQKQEQEQE